MASEPLMWCLAVIRHFYTYVHVIMMENGAVTRGPVTKPTAISSGYIHMRNSKKWLQYLAQK